MNFWGRNREEKERKSKLREMVISELRERRGRNIGRRGFDDAGVLKDGVIGLIGHLERSSDPKTRVKVLRSIAKELCIKEPLLKRALWLMIISCTEGWTHKALTDDEKLNDDIEAAWLNFCEKGNFEVTRRHSFQDALRIAMSDLFQKGEILMAHISDRGLSDGYGVQLLCPSDLDLELNVKADGRRGEIRQGIEINKYGGPEYFYICADSGEKIGEKTYQKKPYREVIHAFMALDPKQERGIPLIEAVPERIKSVGSYQRSALQAAEAGARKMGFYQKKTEGFDEADGLPTSEEEIDKLSEDQLWDLLKKVSKKSPTEIIDGLHVSELPEGWEFQGFDPEYPRGEYEAFFRTHVQSISSGLNLSYASLASDMSAGSFASIRQGLIQEREYFQYIQTFLCDSVIRKIRERWFMSAALKGRFGTKINESNWIQYAKKYRFDPKVFDWIDPKKDAEGKMILLKGGVMSEERLARQCGYGSLEELYREKKRARDLRAKYGLDDDMHGGDEDGSGDAGAAQLQ